MTKARVSRVLETEKTESIRHKILSSLYFCFISRPFIQQPNVKEKKEEEEEEKALFDWQEKYGRIK